MRKGFTLNKTELFPLSKTCYHFEMQTKRRTLRQRLEWEIIERTNSGTMGFIVFAVMIFFFPFGRHEWATAIRICALGTFLQGIVRVPEAARILKQGYMSRREYRRIELLVLFNSACWSAMFGFTTWDLITTGEFSVFAFATFMGFIAGSLLSLPASRLLFNSYLVGMVGGQLALLLTGLLMHIKFDRSLFAVHIGMFFFLYREGNKLRQRMIASNRDQMRLEITNGQLFRSRQELVEQTSRNVHASRLASLGEMAGGIAHEINNPLAIIDLSLDTLQMQVEADEKDLKEKTLHAITRSLSSVHRISAIIRGLRNFSRTGDQDPLVAATLSQVIQDALDLCSEKMKAQAVDLQVHGPTQTSILCRPVEIGQILINLFNNAFDIVSELPIGERRIRVEIATGGGMAVLRVTDSGPPLSLEKKNKIFQPFFTTKPIGMGTGLGLSISRAIAKRHRGDLTLDTAATQTTFVLEIPLAQAAM
jgi:C4-dicarboxylate-specific signal transduction histidine kinase